MAGSRFPYEWVIPYTYDSSPDQVAMAESLDDYLRRQNGIYFEIEMHRNKTLNLCTTRALTNDQKHRIYQLVNQPPVQANMGHHSY